jgi:hypothetical protein
MLPFADAPLIAFCRVSDMFSVEIKVQCFCQAH